MRVVEARIPASGRITQVVKGDWMGGELTVRFYSPARLVTLSIASGVYDVTSLVTAVAAVTCPFALTAVMMQRSV